ncbi:MAG: YqgE/AlgH family protein [Planctomycetia bacterium]|nr:YqgE/AlgH family protein [Planctomycetia bacterium]
MDSLAGKLLVAAPDLGDPNFFSTVVLVVDHDDEGAFGLVLNRESTVMLASAWEETTREPCGRDAPLMLGGPVQGLLSILHGDPARSEREVVPGVHLARDRDAVMALVESGQEPLRVFAGYAGWGPDQLEGELTSGSWAITAATRAFVFSDDVSTLWQRVSRHIADEHLVRWLGVRHMPDRPADN